MSTYDDNEDDYNVNPDEEYEMMYPDEDSRPGDDEDW